VKYGLVFLGGLLVGLYGGAWILGVFLQATPEQKASRARYVPAYGTSAYPQ
jgi:hypothetical protein